MLIVVVVVFVVDTCHSHLFVALFFFSFLFLASAFVFGALNCVYDSLACLTLLLLSFFAFLSPVSSCVCEWGLPILCLSGDADSASGRVSAAKACFDWLGNLLRWLSLISSPEVNWRCYSLNLMPIFLFLPCAKKKRTKSKHKRKEKRLETKRCQVEMDVRVKTERDH